MVNGRYGGDFGGRTVRRSLNVQGDERVLDDEFHATCCAGTGQAVEVGRCVVRDARHAFDGLVQRREEVVPVEGDDRLRLHLVEGLFIEGVDFCCRHFRHGPDAEEHDLGLNVVELPFDVVATRADEDGAAAVADDEVHRAAFLVRLGAGRLAQGLVDGLPEVIADGRRVRVFGRDDRNGKVPDRFRLAEPELVDTVLLHLPAETDVLRRRRPVDLRPGLVGDVRHVHRMVRMRMGDEDGADPAEVVVLHELVHGLFVRLHSRAEHVFPEGWPCDVRVEQDLVLSVVKQQHGRSEECHFHEYLS